MSITEIGEWDRSVTRSVEMVVTVGGVVRPVANVTWGQSLVSSLPDTIAAAAGFGHRTGTITWQRQTRNGDPIHATNTLPSPWRRSTADHDEWIPKPGTPVTVDAVDGQGNTVRVFTGVIDDPAGDGSGAMTTTIVDAVDSFDRTVSLEAVDHWRWPWRAGQERFVTPSSAWVVDDILRQCGYYATPPRPSGHMLDAPLQGSTYLFAEKVYGHANAQLLESRSLVGSNSNPRWISGGQHTSLALCDAYLSYVPYTNPGAGDNQQRVSFVVFPDHEGVATVAVQKKDGSRARVIVDAHRRVYVEGKTAGGPTVRRKAFRLPASLDVDVISVIFRAGRADLASRSGLTANYGIPTPGGPTDEMVVTADEDARIAGVQISDPGSGGGHVATDWSPTAVNHYGWHGWYQIMAPSIRDENAKEVLAEFSEALLTPVWIDHHGMVQVAATNDLHSRPALIGVDVLTDVADLSWKSSLRDIRNRVEVHWGEVVISRNTKDPRATILHWQGSGVTVGREDQIEEVVETPDDEEWFGPSTNVYDGKYATEPYSDGDTTQLGWLNTGQESWWGQTVTYEVTAADGTKEEKERWHTPASAVPPFKRIRLTPWKFTWSYFTTHDVTLRVPEMPEISRRLWGQGLPLFRGTGRAKRHDRVTVKGSQSAVSARTLVHDMGRWCSASAIATNFGDWLFRFTGSAHPVLHGVVVRFDPRLNVGEKILVDSRALHGVALEALVVSVDHDPSADTSTLEVRVVEARTTLQSYDDLRRAWAGASYDSLTALWATINGTYDNLSTDPTWKGF